MSMTATYSPEDNKLRLYPLHRLDEATYQRVAESMLAEVERSVSTLKELQKTAVMCVRGTAVELGVARQVLLAEVEKRLPLYEFRDLTDRQWELVAPFIGDMKYARHSRREILNAILFVIRTDQPWKTIPFEYPPAGTCYRLFLDWNDAGIMSRIAEALNDSMPGIADQIGLRQLKYLSTGSRNDVAARPASRRAQTGAC